MNKLNLYLMCMLLLSASAIFSQTVGSSARQRKKTESTLREKPESLYDATRKRLSGGISMAPYEYNDTIRALFRADRWPESFVMLCAAEKEWGLTSNTSCLYGRYWFHEGDTAVARRYLLLAVREDEANTEAIELLMKLEESCQNYATAIVHLNDLLSFSQYNPHLWRKKIELYRLSGNEHEANRLLERLAKIYPLDHQIQKDLQYQRELQARRMSKQGNEKQSQQAIEELIQSNPRDVQYYLDLSSSLLKEGRLQQAQEVCAKGVNNTRGNRSLIRRRVSILQDQALYQEAETYLRECIRRYHADDLQPLLDYLLEDAASAADNQDAYTLHRRLYAETGSPDALSWLVTAAIRRGWWDDAQFYLAEEQRLFGSTKDILAKQYMVEKRLGNDRKASLLLEQLYVADTADTDIRELLAEKRVRYATDFMQEQMFSSAIPLLLQADSLTNDSDMHALIARRIQTCQAMLPDTAAIDTLDMLQHYVIYLRQHNLDSAYACLMRYRPSLDEYQEVQRWRYSLQSRLQKNSLSLQYQYARRTSVDEWSHNANLTYTRTLTKRHAIELSAAYAGREGASWHETTETETDTLITSAGGTGVQLGAGYYHYFSWGDLSLQAAWASRFLPKALVKLQLTEYLPAEWTLTEKLSWRYLTDEGTYHVFSAGLSATWTIADFILSPSIDAFLMNKHVYFNGGLKMNYYPLSGDRSHIFTAAGVGNAPELTLLDSNLPVRFAHLNTNVSVGGMYYINGHLALNTALDWYVMGNNDASVRNYIYLHIGLNLFF